jgi:hypothetical protein
LARHPYLNLFLPQLHTEHFLSRLLQAQESKSSRSFASLAASNSATTHQLTVTHQQSEKKKNNFLSEGSKDLLLNLFTSEEKKSKT